MTISQAVIFSDPLLTDGNPANDEMVYIIDSLINYGEPVPEGWIDPSTPDADFLGTLDVGEDEPVNLPSGFTLGQNYPNPFNPRTTIMYGLATASRVKIVVHNLLGQPVKTLFEGEQTAGNYSVVWDGSDEYGEPVSSGIYFYRMTAGTFIETKKMLLIK